MKALLDQIIKKKNAGQKQLAVLIDPDKISSDRAKDFCEQCEAAEVDYLFVGGSLIHTGDLSKCIVEIKKHTSLPIIIFPGSNLHISEEANAILLLSLTSGRNPELLIGQHVVAAPILKASGLEILSTSYILIDGGRPTTVSYISGTTPIPSDKPEIAACTALAGEQIGHQLIYLDAGSGAESPVPTKTIQATKKLVSKPLIVGGGINSSEKAKAAYEAGADLLVIGNHLEENPSFIAEINAIRH